MRLVFDIGATKSRFGLSSDGVQLQDMYIVPTISGPDGAKELVSAMKRYVGRHKIQHIAGGIAGTVDRKHGILLESPNLPGWVNVPLAQMINEAIGAPVRLENDTAVVGLGEVMAYSTHGIVVYVTVSTGVNGARFVDGQIDASTYGFEAGRQLIPSRSGEIKTLEELIGGHALQARYGRLPREIDDPAVWETEAGYLAEGLYNMTLLWSPKAIIVGGSMMRDISLLKVQQKLHSFPQIFPEWPVLVPASLGEYGGLYGALALLRHLKH